MDDATFQQLMAVQRSKALPVPPLDAPVGDSQASPQPVMDDATFQRLRASVQNSITSATPSLDATQPAPAQGNTSQGATPTLSPPGEALSAALEVHPPPSATLDEPDPEEPLGHPSSFLDAAAGGAAESFLQTKDFLTGGAPVDKSPIRAAIEAGTQTAENSGFVPGTVGVLSQFTMGMLGAGKIAEGASLVSAGAKAALEALPKVTAAGEAAAAGAVAFDPHQDFLSPIVQYVPFIGEPLAAAIGSNEDTPDLYGRLKNALQSIGVDAAVAGTVIAASKVYRALAAGDHGAASVATGELQDAHDAHQAAQAAAEPVRAPEAAIPSSEPVPATGSPEASQAPEIVPPTAAQEAHPAVPTEGGPSVSFEEAPGQPTEAPGAQEAQPATSAAEVAPGAPEDTLSAPEAASDETAPDNAAPTPENPKFKPSVTVTPEEAESILSSSQSDIDALTEHGTVQGAVDAGHVFGQGQGIPWNKLHLPGEVDDFVARVSDTLQAKLDAAKGGDILSDATVLRQVNGMASYFNINPAVITSRIAQAGNDATRMVANMDAAYLLANRMHQDAWALGQRINLGDLTGFATREDAVQEFQRQVTMASSMLASGQSMRASAGRAMRHGRSEFAVNPELAAQVQQLGGDKLLALFNATAGNPKLLKRVTQPGFMKRAMGDFGFLVQNNLLWSWQTHLVNFLSNAYMLAARPAERIVGGALTGDAASVREAFAQYGYYVSLFPQAFP
ncbi:MAG TPA: hypothetical protein VHW66_02690, partial [Stellaceae bacterium]|nr:hypothetical protein [Stellaceae bacterium]